jgi:hypothetical protein
VLFLATGIGETEIDELDVVFLDHFDDVLWGCHSAKSPEQVPASPADIKNRARS